MEKGNGEEKDKGGSPMEAEAAEKKRGGEMVAEVLKKVAPEVLETAASEKKVLEGEMVTEVVEKAASEVVEKAVSSVVDTFLEKALTDAAEKVVSEAAAARKREEKGKGKGVAVAPMEAEADQAEAAGKREEGGGERQEDDPPQEQRRRFVSFMVTEASAKQSKELTRLIDEIHATYIPLDKVDSKTLEKLIEYRDEHGNNKPDTDEEKEKLEKFDKALINKLDEDKPCLLNVLVAANAFRIGGLFDLSCERVADTIKGKTPDEVRAAFNITGNFTLEYREEETSGESFWVYEEEHIPQ